MAPVWLFHAIDDETVRLGESRQFVARAKAAGHEVTMDPAARGGHYDGMIDKGIDEAIRWMQREDSPEAPLVEAGARRAGSGPGVRGTPRRPSARRPFPAVPRVLREGRIRAYVYLKIITYPSSGNAESMARSALRSLIWAEPDSIRIRPGGQRTGYWRPRLLAQHERRQAAVLEDIGFVIGGTRLQPVQ